MPRIPEVYILPPEDRVGGDPKWRRHVVARDCDDSVDPLANMIYATGSATEANNGAIFDHIDPAEYVHRGGPFEIPTWIYYTRLVSVGFDMLTRRMGTATITRGQVKHNLATAMGIGTGSSVGYGPAKDTRRGHLVRYIPEIAEEVEGVYGLVVTDPAYSLQNGYQITVPLLDLAPDPETGEVLETNEFDRIIAGESWLSTLSPALTEATLCIPLAFSVLDTTEITWVGLAMDDDLMAEVDARLVSYFDL